MLAELDEREKLQHIDWRKAWIEYTKARKEPNAASFWDGRAKDFSRKAGSSPYSDIFIHNLDLPPGSSVLDVGCGGGTLALPLARAGHEVFAVDFSAAMLQALEETAQKEGLANIRTALLDFNAPWEDWEAIDITENAVDVAFASRSTMVKDLGEAFEKLERAARSKVAVTLATEFGPRGVRRMGESVGGVSWYLPDYMYGVNILFQMNRYPTLSYIKSDKADEYGSMQHILWAFLAWDVGGIPCK